MFRLDAQSLWVDEALTWGAADIGRPLELGRVLENVHGPLFGVVVHAWGALAGDSEWALRFPAAVFSILLVPAIAWFGARWLGAEVAPWAAWLAALSPFQVWYGQESRNYSMLMFCAVVSSAVLVGMRERISLRGVMAYVVSAGAGLLANFSFLLLAPVHAEWWLGAPGVRRRRLAIAAGVALVLALVLLPWIASISTTWDLRRLLPGKLDGETPLRGSTTFHVWALPFALHSFAAGYGLGPPVRMLRGDVSLEALAPHLGWLVAEALVFGALGLLGLRALHRRGRLSEGLMALAVPLAGLTYLAVENVKVFHPRYAAVAAPMFLVVWAAALADLGPRLRVMALAGVLGLWIVALGHHYFDPRYGKEDMRGAAAWIAAHGQDGEKVVAVNAAEPLLYYYRGPLPVERFWLGYAADPGRLEGKFEASRAGASAAWVVLTRPEDLDPAGTFVRHMEVRYPAAERRTFEGVWLWHLPIDIP